MGKAKTVTAPTLTEADRELLMLAGEVVKCGESARNLVLRAHTQAHVARFADVDAWKRFERQRLGHMLLVWRGLRPHDGAPYVDARMLLTQAILFHAKAHRDLGSNAARLQERAEECAAIIAMHYPDLDARMREPDRIERIRSAIASAATSTKRRPWRLIALTWDGIEAKPIDGEVWRVTYEQARPREA